MNQLKLYGLCGVLLLIIGISSCTSEEAGVINTVEEEYTTLRIPVTRSSDEDEARVLNARIIVTHTTGLQTVVANEYQSYPNLSFNVEVPVGDLNIYLIANEKTEWNLASITSALQLKDIGLNYNAYPVVDDTYPIPMLGQYENVHVNIDGNVTKNGSPVNLNDSQGTVKRIFAKATLELICVFNELAGREPIQVKSVSVTRMPKISYLLPRSYGTEVSHFFNGANAPSTDYKPTLSGSDVIGFTGSSSFYIPEYLLTNIDYYTYLSVVVNLVNDVSKEREYKIVLGDGIGDPLKDNDYMLGNSKTVSDVRISRNTHYKYTARIKSFSETSNSDLEIHARIIDWNEEINDPTKPEEYTLTILPQSEFNLSAGVGTVANPYEGGVTVRTDYSEGWKVSKSSAGITILSSGGDQLRFRISDNTGISWAIDVTAGKITKQIKLTR